MGICKLKDEGKNKYLNRRIDIKVYPRSQYGFAILYFTGPAQLNKNMRFLALEHGFSMSDSGIKKDDKDKGSIDGEPSKSMKKNIAVNKSITQSLKALNQR